MSKPGVVIFRRAFQPTIDDSDAHQDFARVECDHIDVHSDTDEVYAQVDGEAWRWHWHDVKEVVRPLDGDDGR